MCVCGGGCVSEGQALYVDHVGQAKKLFVTNIRGAPRTVSVCVCLCVCVCVCVWWGVCVRGPGTVCRPRWSGQETLCHQHQGGSQNCECVCVYVCECVCVCVVGGVCQRARHCM